jgi:hypothetical protein
MADYTRALELVKRFRAMITPYGLILELDPDRIRIRYTGQDIATKIAA